MCRREGIEKKRWARGGRGHGNLSIWKAVGKVKLKIAALKKVFLSVFTRQVFRNIFLYIEKYY